MPTDYVMFIHGVSTRETRETPEYADGLFQKIEDLRQDNQRELVSVPLYWGDVNVDAENDLLGTMETSPLWNSMWFKDFRSKQLLQFVGDAALYLSRHIGSKVVKKFLDDPKTQNMIQNFQPNDRLHLVTHSWGTVILLDVLFAPRWDDQKAPGHQYVMAIRDVIFGLTGVDNTGQRRDTTEEGIVLAGIHTMGSPIPLFSLTSDTGSGSDITPNLRKLLTNLHKKEDKKLPWRNYVHPGDPVAYPIKQLMQKLAENPAKNYLDIEDILTDVAGWDWLFTLVSQNVITLLNGGDAHGSYWGSDKVAQEIHNVLSHS